MSRADRVRALLEALQERASVSGPALAERLGVDVRTVRRDVAALRGLGIPVESKRGRGGSYRLPRGHRFPRPPGLDPLAFAQRAPQAHVVEVVLHTDFPTAARHFPPPLAELEPLTETTTRLKFQADSLGQAADLLAAAGCEFTIVSPDGLKDAVAKR